MMRSSTRSVSILVASVVTIFTVAISASSASATTQTVSTGAAVMSQSAGIGSIAKPLAIYGPYLWNTYETAAECDAEGQYGVNHSLWYSYTCTYKPDISPHYYLYYWTID